MKDEIDLLKDVGKEMQFLLTDVMKLENTEDSEVFNNFIGITFSFKHKITTKLISSIANSEITSEQAVLKIVTLSVLEIVVCNALMNYQKDLPEELPYIFKAAVTDYFSKIDEFKKEGFENADSSN